MHLDFRIPFTRTRIGTGRPCAWQRGFWIDRITTRNTAVGLGLILLYINRESVAL